MSSTQYEAAAVKGRLVHRIMQIVWRCVSAFNRWYERRMTLRYLQSVDDRILDDIGIRRTEILAAIYGGRNRADV
jgi:uncharacterized protein YjiS (DUF1127 family)